MALRSKDFNSQDQLLPQELHNRSDDNIQFYQQYRKIFATAYYLSLQHRELADSKDDLWKKLLVYEKRADQEFRDKMRKQPAQRKKRFRRAASEIEKRYHCEEDNCNRGYGSEGSLLQHVKLKHPGKYQEVFQLLRLQQQLNQKYSESDQIDD